MELREKKEKHCASPQDEADEAGDQWDHIAQDVPSRFVVSLVTDKRTPEALEALVADFAERTNHQPPRLVTTDDCASYEPVLLEQYGERIEVRRKDGELDRRFRPYKVWPDGSVYATVKKTFKEGEVAERRQKLALGTAEQLRDALSLSAASKTVNTSFVERQNATDRAHNARKARKTLSFSKDVIVHLAVSWWVMFCYNFHFFNAGLSVEVGFDEQRQRRELHHRTPAMAIGLAEHPWSIAEILLLPLLHTPSRLDRTPAYFRPWKAQLPSPSRPQEQDASCPNGAT